MKGQNPPPGVRGGWKCDCNCNQTTMNISDAAREAAGSIWRTTYGSHVIPCESAPEIIQSAIDTATAALTLELETVRQQLAEAREDSRRLDWAMKNVSGGGWAAAGVFYSAGCNRKAIDAVMNRDPQPAH